MAADGVPVTARIVEFNGPFTMVMILYRQNLSLAVKRFTYNKYMNVRGANNDLCI